METVNLEPLLSDPELETTEVLIGLEPDEPRTKLEAYIGDEGRILKEPGFDIYRVRLTTALLADFVVSEPTWIEYIEHAGDGIVPLLNTDNHELDADI